MWMLYAMAIVPAVISLFLLIGMFTSSEGAQTVPCIVIFVLMAFSVFTALGESLFPVKIVRIVALLFSVALALRFITLKREHLSEKIVGLLISITAVVIQVITFITV